MFAGRRDIGRWHRHASGTTYDPRVLSTLLRLLPVIVGMATGYLLVRLGVVNQTDGEFVFRVVFYVCMPALIFTSVSRISMNRQLVIFVLAAPVVVTIGYVVGRVVVRRAGFTGTQVPVVLVACMVVNAGFMVPFVQALYGAEGVVRVAAFDAANTALTLTWAYYLAARGNPRHQGGSVLFNRLLRSPPLYGVAAGLIVNLTGIPVPSAISAVTTTFGSATALLIPLGVGILFTPVHGHLRRVAIIVGTRLCTTLAIGVAIVLIFGLTGVDRAIMLLLSVAPVAFVTVTFSSLENLDVELATAALSVSLVASLVLSLAIAVTLA
jgi:predicted permease